MPVQINLRNGEFDFPAFKQFLAMVEQDSVGGR
jgi:hypothetical protein